MKKQILLNFVSFMCFTQIFGQLAWKTYDTSNSNIGSNSINQILIDSLGNKWIATDNGLSKFDGTSWTTYNTTNSGISNNYIHSIAIDGKGNKWIGTNKGLCKFDGYNWTIYNSSNSLLLENTVTKVAIDLEGNKWIGTAGGLCKFDDKQLTLEQQWIRFNSTTNIGLRINSIVIDSKNNKWVTYLDENMNIIKLCMFDGTSWKNYNTSNSDIGSNSVVQIVIDSLENKWITTLNGLYKLDITNKWVVYNTTNSGISSNQTYKIVIDKKGVKWITTDKGLSKFDNNVWTTFNTSNSGIPYNNLWNIVIDSLGNKWISYYDDWDNHKAGIGMTKFDDVNWTTYNNSNSGLVSNYIYQIIIDSEGNKWVSCYDNDNLSTVVGGKYQGRGLSKLEGNGSSLLCSVPLDYSINYTKFCQNLNESYAKISSSLNQSNYINSLYGLNSGTLIKNNLDLIFISTNGYYKLKIEDSVCFTDTVFSLTIQDFNLPIASITAGSATTFCQGGNVSLTSSNGSSYLWSTGATTSSISPTTAGSYTVEVTDVNGCKKTSSATVVSVNTLPTSTITAGGATTFCQGASVSLTSSNGSSYLWSTGATTSSISPTTAGSYTVEVTDANGCKKISTATDVIVNTIPTATITANGQTTACFGSGLSLQSTNNASTLSYLWSSGEITQNIYPTTSGTYSLKLTDNNGCSNNSNSILITINPLPIVKITANGPLTYCSNQLTELVASTGVSYLWNDGSITKKITPNQSGDYNVKLTDINGCSNTSASISVVVNDCAGLEEVESLFVNIYPNPTSDILTISSSNYLGKYSIEMYDNTGKLVKEYLSNEKDTTISVNEFANGVYTIKLIGDNYSQTTKFSLVR